MKAEYIFQSLAGISSFTQDIYVDFPVKKLIVQIMYLRDVTEAGTTALRCQQMSTSSNGFIGFFQDSSQMLETSFDYASPKMFNGTMKFDLLSVTGALVNTRAGDISIVLNFYP